MCGNLRPSAGTWLRPASRGRAGKASYRRVGIREVTVSVAEFFAQAHRGQHPDSRRRSSYSHGHLILQGEPRCRRVSRAACRRGGLGAAGRWAARSAPLDQRYGTVNAVASVRSSLLVCPLLRQHADSDPGSAPPASFPRWNSVEHVPPHRPLRPRHVGGIGCVQRSRDLDSVHGVSNLGLRPATDHNTHDFEHHDVGKAPIVRPRYRGRAPRPAARLA